MEFTFYAYDNLLKKLIDNGYCITDYHNYHENEKCVILRHDIDYDLRRAVHFAKIEKENKVKSTYFVFLTSDFYNIFSKKSFEIIHSLLDCGHEVGLHFDEVRYSDNSTKWEKERIVENILHEISILSKAIGCEIKSVSMHRPSVHTLNSDLQIPGIVNSYSDEFFKDFKYVSDSRMRWRENIEEIVSDGKSKKLHILTHPFWYSNGAETISEKLECFIRRATSDRTETLNDNITNLEELIATSV